MEQFDRYKMRKKAWLQGFHAAQNVSVSGEIKNYDDDEINNLFDQSEQEHRSKQEKPQGNLIFCLMLGLVGFLIGERLMNASLGFWHSVGIAGDLFHLIKQFVIAIFWFTPIIIYTIKTEPNPKLQ